MTLTRVHKGEFGSGSSPSQRIDPAHTCHFHPDFVADSVHVFHPRHIHTLTVTHKCTKSLAVSRARGELAFRESIPAIDVDQLVSYEAI